MSDAAARSSWRSRSGSRLDTLVEPQVRTSFETARPFDMFSTLAPIGLGQSMRVHHNEGWRATGPREAPPPPPLPCSAPGAEGGAGGRGAGWAAGRAAAVCGEED